MVNSLDILAANGLSKTKKRIQVLDLFLNANRVLSLKEIEVAVTDMDRITLYRTLKTFESRGIIHKATDGTKHPKYAMCNEHCDEHNHQDNHAHFHCTVCEQTTCLEAVPTPNIPNIPKGFKVAETNLIMSGVCNNCG